MAIGGLAQVADIVENLFDRLGRQPEDLRLVGQQPKQFGDLVARRGADLAQVLGEHQIGRGLPNRRFVDHIEALAAAQPLGDRNVDLGLAHRLDRQGVAHHNRLGASLRRVVAFMADAADLVAQPQGEGHLGSGRQEGYDPPGHRDQARAAPAAAGRSRRAANRRSRSANPPNRISV